MTEPETRNFRFRGIEGLRGWLACIVMTCHIVRLSGMHLRYPVLDFLVPAAGYSVLIFIIISGFVITNLLLTKQETYFPYISRRFLRIFPVYLVCLTVGIIATRLYVSATLNEPWGLGSPLTHLEAVQMRQLTEVDFFPKLIAHITMLHGAVPDNFIYGGEVAFLPPAWSLSLEWQFYLLAPLIIYAALRSERSRICLAVTAVLAFAIYRSQLLAVYFLTSVLPATALLFATGISTRLYIKKIPRPASYPVASAIVLSLFFFISADFIPYYVWSVFVFWMLLGDSSNGATATIKVGFGTLLDSKPARYLGDLSYAIYLSHVPVTQLVLFVCIGLFHMAMVPTFWIVAIAAPLLTGLASIALHQFVERPCIAYGRSLFLNRRISEPAIAN